MLCYLREARTTSPAFPQGLEYTGFPTHTVKMQEKLWPLLSSSSPFCLS